MSKGKEIIINIDGSDECPICMDHGDSPIEKMKCCDKNICNDCFNKLPNPECPYCRRPIAAPPAPKPMLWPGNNIEVTCRCCCPLTCCFAFAIGMIFGGAWYIY